MAVTRNWSATRYKRGEFAYYEYMVDGVGDNPDAAAAAVPFQKGSTHNLDNRLVAEQPEVTDQPGPLIFVVGVNFRTFTLIPGGGSPIDERPTAIFLPGVEAVQTSVDAYGRVIRNTAGDVATGLIANISFLTLKYTRVEAFFDPTFALGFIDRLNEDQYEIYVGAGQWRTVPPYTSVVRHIGPEEEFAVEDGSGITEYVRVSYFIEFRDLYPQVGGESEEARSAFHHRFPNMGHRGWYELTAEDESTSTEIGEIDLLDSEGVSQPVSQPVMLNADGTPKESSYTVSGGTPVANPNPAPEGGTFITDSSSGEVVAVYAKHRLATFGNMSTGQ